MSRSDLDKAQDMRDDAALAEFLQIAVPRGIKAFYTGLIFSLVAYLLSGSIMKSLTLGALCFGACWFQQWQREIQRVAIYAGIAAGIYWCLT